MNPAHIPALVVLIMAAGLVYWMIHYNVLPPVVWEDEKEKKK